MIRREYVYTTEFEEIVLAEIEKQVIALPVGAADCYIGPSRENRRIVAPSFEIQPTNPNAARISGAVLEGEGVIINVGNCRRDLRFQGASAAEAWECAQLVSRICSTVFAGNFTEQVRVDNYGRRISSRLRLRLDGRDLRMWNNRLFRDLFRRTSTRNIRYAPYTGR